LLQTRSSPEEAEASFHRAISVQEQLSRAYPDVLEYHNDLGRSHYDLGKMLHERGQPARAVSALGRAVARHESSLRLDPANEVYRSNLFEDQSLLMIVGLRLGDLEQASGLAEAGVVTLPDQAVSYLRGAAGLADCSARSAADPAPSSTRRASLSDEYADRAARLLRLGFERGLLTGLDIFSLKEFRPLVGKTSFERLRNEIEVSPGSSARAPAGDEGR